MFTLSGFADEISADLNEQMDVMEEEGIRYIELRGVNNKNVLSLTDQEIEEIRDALEERGFGISAIGSPIGKVKITDDFEEHLEQFRRALYLAEYFDSDYIRLFSYYIPEGEDLDTYRDEVMRRMQIKTEMAKEAGIILLHENESDIYGENAHRCRDLLTTVDSPHLRAIFDPANFVVNDISPYPEALLQVVEYVDYLHIKDARTTSGGKKEITPAGEGDGGIPEVLTALMERGFSGFLSLEPHLAQAGRMQGFSGPEAFQTAARALKGVIEEIGGQYD